MLLLPFAYWSLLTPSDLCPLRSSHPEYRLEWTGSKSEYEFEGHVIAFEVELELQLIFVDGCWCHLEFLGENWNDFFLVFYDILIFSGIKIILCRPYGQGSRDRNQNDSQNQTRKIKSETGYRDVSDDVMASPKSVTNIDIALRPSDDRLGVRGSLND